MKELRYWFGVAFVYVFIVPMLWALEIVSSPAMAWYLVSMADAVKDLREREKGNPASPWVEKNNPWVRRHE